MLWPLAWAVGSGVGTLRGGFAFGRASAPGAVVLSLAQAAAVALFARRSSRRVRKADASQGRR